MNSRKKTARLAGLLYFLCGIPAVFSLQYVHHALMNHSDAEATANNIQNSQMLLRLGIVAELLSTVFFMFLGLVLYQLLKEVSKKNALYMLALVLVSVPISFLNELNQIAALTLSSGAHFLSTFTKPQLDALIMLFLNAHMDGANLVQIFWGLWLFPFGILVYRSGFLPRIVGVLLIIACFAYVAGSLTTLLFPAYGNTGFMIAASLGGLGEGVTGLWLLIKGAKEQQAENAALA